jgi:hypothetical protein
MLYLCIAFCAFVSTGSAFCAEGAGRRLSRNISGVASVCCSEEIAQIESVSGDRSSGLSITAVYVPKFPVGGSEAFTRREEAIIDGHIYPRGIYVRKELMKLLTADELLAIIAHEFGHLTDDSGRKADDLEGEFFADEFSLRALAALNKDPSVLLTAIKKMRRTRIFANEDFSVVVEERMDRIKKFIRANGYGADRDGGR